MHSGSGTVCPESLCSLWKSSCPDWDKALSSLVWPQSWASCEQEVGAEASWCIFQPQWSCDPVTSHWSSFETEHWPVQPLSWFLSHSRQVSPSLPCPRLLNVGAHCLWYCFHFFHSMLGQSPNRRIVWWKAVGPLEKINNPKLTQMNFRDHAGLRRGMPVGYHGRCSWGCCFNPGRYGYFTILPNNLFQIVLPYSVYRKSSHKTNCGGFSEIHLIYIIWGLPIFSFTSIRKVNRKRSHHLRQWKMEPLVAHWELCMEQFLLFSSYLLFSFFLWM